MGFFTDYSIVIEIPVVWGEMDAYGHVNNIIYYRYLESVRIKYFEEMQFLEYKEETGNRADSGTHAMPIQITIEISGSSYSRCARSKIRSRQVRHGIYYRK